MTDNAINASTVTLVTQDAAQAENACIDGYNDASQMYREIYDELRENTSLAKFVVVVQSSRSRAWWSKYERGLLDLDRTAKNELRAAVGLEPLVPSVTNALAHVHPDAQVWRIGDNDVAHRVVTLCTDREIALRANGVVEVLSGVKTPENACNRRYAQKRAPVYRPVLPVAMKQRIADSGHSVEELIEAGLKTLETMENL